MCYTTVTHFNRCSHRTSTTTPCQHSLQHRPTIYHSQSRYAWPCMTDTSKSVIHVRSDELCDACRRVNSWFAGGGGTWSNNRMRRDQSGAWRMKKKYMDPAVRMAAGGHPYRNHSSATQGRATSRPSPAESMYPVPTAAAQEHGYCPLSEAFERAVTIGGGDGDALNNGSEVISGDLGDGEGRGRGMDRSRIREHNGEYGPFKPPHSSSGARNRFGGLPSWASRYGPFMRRTRRRGAGNKKQVRFDPTVEVLYFRRDWATGTLGHLSRNKQETPLR